jgi:hypothetical protein
MKAKVFNDSMGGIETLLNNWLKSKGDRITIFSTTQSQGPGGNLVLTILYTETDES